MSDDDDEFVNNEPVATGSVRTELRGDAQLAQNYVRAARRLLGALRTRYGVNERIAEGEPGGFFKQAYQVQDGSLIEVITNDGQDTVRITCAKQPTSRPAEGSQVSAHAISSSELASSAEALLGEAAGEEPPPTPRRKEDEEEEEKAVDEYQPYLWIGARIKDGPKDEEGEFKQKLHACVWEMPDQEGDDPVILSNRDKLLRDLDGSDYHDTAVAHYPLQAWQRFAPEDDREHGIAYTENKLFMLLEANGYPMRIPDYQAGEDEDIEWDVIFISDPDNELEIETPDGPMEGTSDGGEFFVKIMVVGPDCGRDRFGTVEVELRIITGKGGYVDDSTHTFQINAFTEYKMGILPLGWLPDSGPPGLDPTGCQGCDEPVADYGTNRHGPHWWQGMATVELAPEQTDVPPNQLQLSITDYTDELALPPTGFMPEAWWTHLDLCPACVETYTDGFTVSAGPAQILADENNNTGGCPGLFSANARVQNLLVLNPADELRAACRDAGINSASFTDLPHGITLTIPIAYSGSGSFGFYSHYQTAWMDEDCHPSTEMSSYIAAGAASAGVPPPNAFTSWHVARFGLYDGWFGTAYFLVTLTYDQHGNVVSKYARNVVKAVFDAEVGVLRCARVEQDDSEQ